MSERFDLRTASAWPVGASGEITGADVSRPTGSPDYWPVAGSGEITGSDVSRPTGSSDYWPPGDGGGLMGEDVARLQRAAFDAAISRNLSIAPRTASRISASQEPTNRSMSSSSGRVPAKAYGIRNAIALTTAALIVIGVLLWGLAR